jgi:hypothetical protein
VAIRYSKLAIVAIMAAVRASAHRITSTTEGVVTEIAESSLTIATSSGKKVETELDPKATFKRSGQTIRKSEIRIGDRVIVHARLIERKLVADAVQVKASTRETARR